MRILKVEPGKAPYAKEMEEGLKAIQREVEGLFQPLSMGDGVVLCCNDEGKLNGMQPNRRLEMISSAGLSFWREMTMQGASAP